MYERAKGGSICSSLIYLEYLSSQIHPEILRLIPVLGESCFSSHLLAQKTCSQINQQQNPEMKHLTMLIFKALYSPSSFSRS